MTNAEGALAAELVALAADRSPVDARLLLVGWLNQKLARGKRAVLVGGGAVELYTAGEYTTGDVDVVGDRNAIRQILRDAGFEGDARQMFHPELGIVAEVPGSELRPTEEIVDVEFESFRIPVVSVEDTIVDRLLAAKSWRSATDWEQALLLFTAHRERVDARKLADKAQANECSDALAELLRVGGGS